MAQPDLNKVALCLNPCFTPALFSQCKAFVKPLGARVTVNCLQKSWYYQFTQVSNKDNLCRWARFFPSKGRDSVLSVSQNPVCQSLLRLQILPGWESIQCEKEDSNIYHSMTQTKNKPWQLQPMQGLVYANHGHRSDSDQKHNKLSLLLIHKG